MTRQNGYQPRQGPAVNNLGFRLARPRFSYVARVSLRRHGVPGRRCPRRGKARQLVWREACGSWLA